MLNDWCGLVAVRVFEIKWISVGAARGHLEDYATISKVTGAVCARATRLSARIVVAVRGPCDAIDINAAVGVASTTGRVQDGDGTARGHPEDQIALSPP
jgi:hypothetical protein